MTKRRKFNGKPMEHWEEMAAEMVVDILLRGHDMYNNPNSIPGMIASGILLNMAVAYRKDLTEKVLDERDRAIAGFAAIMAEITSGKSGAPIKRSAKAAGMRVKR